MLSITGRNIAVSPAVFQWCYWKHNLGGGLGFVTFFHCFITQSYTYTYTYTHILHLTYYNDLKIVILFRLATMRLYLVEVSSSVVVLEVGPGLQATV